MVKSPCKTCEAWYPHCVLKCGRYWLYRCCRDYQLKLKQKQCRERDATQYKLKKPQQKGAKRG